MSFLHSILSFFGINRWNRPKYGKVAMLSRGLNGEWIERDAAEVDNLRERYSAARYIEHMKAAMAGDETGRGEWSRVLKSMSPDDAAAFWCDFDALTEAGAWVHVLTPEEMAKVKERIIEKLPEYRAMGEGLMSDFGIPPDVMHQVTALTMNADGTAFALNSERYDAPPDVAAKYRALLQEMDDADVLAWAEDYDEQAFGDDLPIPGTWPVVKEETANEEEHEQEPEEAAEVGLEDEDPQVEFEIEVGEDPEERR